ncbi:MAG: NAD-dependent epimerase/dehydratase family protein [archaeon]|nr:NAD-dependent epimerase/dehydratase family protein [archaeon]
MKIFLTGGTGFNGKYLLDLLKDEEVLLLTRKRDYASPRENVKALSGDLSNTEEWRKELERFSPDVTVHLAWDGIPYDYGEKISEENLRNSSNLMSVLFDIGCPKIVAAGTCWEYGKNQGQLDEENITHPIKPIAIAKDTLYKTTKEIASEKGVDFLWARFFYVYGAGRKETTLIPYLVNCAIKNEKPDIKNPFSSYDFIYVEDVANAMFELVKNGRGIESYNIGTGKSTSILDVSKIIYSSLNLNSPFDNMTFPEGESFDNFLADISKMKHHLNWEPRFSLEDGIKKTISSIQ